MELSNVVAFLTTIKETVEWSRGRQKKRKKVKKKVRTLSNRSTASSQKVCVRTSMPRRFLHRTHLLNPGRQYSTKYSSVYSTPWPFPNLPWVLVDVSIRGLCRFTSRYSLPSFVTIFFGHQAPPPLSCLSLGNRGITTRIITTAPPREYSRAKSILYVYVDITGSARDTRAKTPNLFVFPSVAGDTAPLFRMNKQWRLYLTWGCAANFLSHQPRGKNIIFQPSVFRYA